MTSCSGGTIVELLEQATNKLFVTFPGLFLCSFDVSVLAHIVPARVCCYNVVADLCHVIIYRKILIVADLILNIF